MAITAVTRPHAQAHYTFAQLKQLWIDAGGDSKVASLMAAIGLAESSGDPTAVHRNTNGTVDRGLWQINSSHGWGTSSLDPRASARQAVIVYKAQGPKAWSAYKNGSFARYLTPQSSALFPGVGKALTKIPGGNILFGSGPGGVQGKIADAATPDVGGWVSGVEQWAAKEGALALLYLTFTALALAFLVLGGLRAFGQTPAIPFTRRTYTPPNLQDQGFPEGF